MNTLTLHASLARLIRGQRIGALGTLFQGAPYVSMMPYAVSDDLDWIFIHVSRLAQHTQNLLQDRRVSLLIAEPDAPDRDPTALERITIRGEAAEVIPAREGYTEAMARYLERFPNSALNFQLGDFSFYRLRPGTGRYGAGFAKIHDLTFEDFEAAAAAERSDR